ncbi:alpha/beta hydrolase fold domain-containing protein [Micromonospora sp. NPDC049366]|uniref:alpha/beta hydrolase fold domain-containing protein n=1 Tax=Micromonospora sp. NPDC049366 TaxID=3364271 RepID=UPI0037A049FF
MTIPEPSRLADRILHRDIVVAAHAGFRPLTLDVAVPPAASAPAPVLLFIHGGAWLHGSPKQPADWLMAADPFTTALRAGFAVAFAQYRLSGEARFPAQLDDVRSAVRWLRRDGGALGLDGGRIGVWGESAGGHLASMIALTGTDDDSRVRAAVCWYAPSNLSHMQRQAHPLAEIDHDAPDAPESLLIGGPVPQHPDLARAASPVTYVSPQAPPMLLVHGDRDLIVPVGQSQELAAALRAVGADVELLVIPGAGHCFVGVPLTPIVDTTLAHFRRVLIP